MSFDASKGAIKNRPIMILKCNDRYFPLRERLDQRNMDPVVKELARTRSRGKSKESWMSFPFYLFIILKKTNKKKKKTHRAKELLQEEPSSARKSRSLALSCLQEIRRLSQRLAVLLSAYSELLPPPRLQKLQTTLMTTLTICGLIPVCSRRLLGPPRLTLSLWSPQTSSHWLNKLLRLLLLR